MRERLTVRIKGYREAPDRELYGYWTDPEDLDSAVGVPMHFGLELARQKGLKVTYQLCEGRPIQVSSLPDPFHPNAAPNQEAFFSSTVEACRRSPAVLAEAPTGSGKTATACHVIGTFKRSTLVIVPSKELAANWRKELSLHLGLREEDMGIVEGNKCVYEGKAVTLAVIHNLVQKEFSAEFYDSFGILIWDECHRLGAESFSQSMGLFAARYRLGLTATPRRKDGAQALFLDYFGPPSVRAESEAMAAEVRVVNIPHRLSSAQLSFCRTNESLVKALSRAVYRNEELVKLIRVLYRNGRNVLVISDKIKQLQSLMRLCAEGPQALPAPDMGLFTRTVYDRKKVRTQPQEYLDRVKAECRVIFTTYQMSKEGINIPRLDAGIDATPKADGVQCIGRIRRPVPGKKTPVWFTIRDVGLPLLENFTKARLRDYLTANVRIIDHGTP